MSRIKRAIYPEDYALIDGIQAKCNHANFNEYFEKCDDCGTTLDQLPEVMQAAWYAQFDDDETPEHLVERAEIIRDSMREDGINV